MGLLFARLANKFICRLGSAGLNYRQKKGVMDQVKMPYRAILCATQQSRSFIYSELRCFFEEEVNIMVPEADFAKNQAKDFSRQIWAVCNCNH